MHIDTKTKKMLDEIAKLINELDNSWVKTRLIDFLEKSEEIYEAAIANKENSLEDKLNDTE